MHRLAWPDKTSIPSHFLRIKTLTETDLEMRIIHVYLDEHDTNLIYWNPIGRLVPFLTDVFIFSLMLS